MTMTEPTIAQEVEDREIQREKIAAIRRNHLKANIDKFERNPTLWGLPVWSEATVDPGGTIFGPGPYLKVPIKGGEWDGTRQRVYAPAQSATSTGSKVGALMGTPSLFHDTRERRD